MVSRVSSFGIGSRRDVGLYVVATVLLVVFVVLWAIFIVPVINDQVLNKYFLALVVLAAGALVGLIPSFVPGWGRAARKPRASFMVRFGVALEIFALVITPIGLFYATDPQRSVPVAFAAFTAMLVGVFVAGFGGNMLAPPRA